MKHITFYLDFVSPYAYLAFEALPAALQGHSVSVTYKPILFAGLLRHYGQLGPAEIPAKREWTYRQVLCELVDTIESDVVQAPLADIPTAARKLLSDRCAAVRSAGSSFMSPCVSVCRMDTASGVCLGCLRTIEEIIAWSKVEDPARRVIWSRIEKRLQGDLA